MPDYLGREQAGQPKSPMSFHRFEELVSPQALTPRLRNRKPALQDELYRLWDSLEKKFDRTPSRRK